MRIRQMVAAVRPPASVKVKRVVNRRATSASQEGKGDVLHPDLLYWPTHSIPGSSDHHFLCGRYRVRGLA